MNGEVITKVKMKHLLTGALGLFFGLLVVLEPLLMYKVDSDFLTFKGESLPISVGSILIPALVLSLILLILRIKNIKRSYRDQIFFILFVCTVYIPYLSYTQFRPTFFVIVISSILFFLRGSMEGRFNFIWTPAFIFLFLFFLSFVISAYSPVGGVGGVKAALIANTGAWIIPIFFLINFIRSRKQIYILIEYFIVASAISAVIGIFQVIIFVTAGKIWVYSEVGQPLIDYFGIIVLPRVSALFVGCHVFGLILINTGCILFLYLLTPGIYEKKHKIYYLIAFLLCCTALFFTHTRQNWISFLTMMLVALYIRRPSLRKPFIFLIIAGCILAVSLRLPQYMIQRFMVATPGSIQFRIEAMQESVDLTKKYPITGTGLSRFTQETYLQNLPHNLSLAFSSETGLVGMAAFYLLFFFITFRLLYYAIRCGDLRNQTILYAFFLIMLMIFLDGLSDSIRQTKALWFFMGLAEASICQFALLKEGKKLYPEFGFSAK